MSWKTAVIRPMKDSTPLQWNCIIFPCLHYDQVNESFPDEDVSYIFENVDSQADTWQLHDLMSAPTNPPNNRMVKIQKVKLYCRARAQNSTRPMPEIEFDIHNWTIPSVPIANPLTTRYQTFSYEIASLGVIFNERPITIDDVDMAEFQIVSDIPVANIIRCTQCYMHVYWDYLRAPGFQRVTWTP